MAIQSGSQLLAEVGGTALRGQHVHARPAEYGVLGHYRASTRWFDVASDYAATTRIFELRNPSASVLIVPTSLKLTAIFSGSDTAFASTFDCYKLTGFTALDTTNNVTVTPSRVPSLGKSFLPSVAQLRRQSGSDLAMTGGTMTKDASAFAFYPYAVAVAGGRTAWPLVECLGDAAGAHPFVLGKDEGLLIEKVTGALVSISATLVVNVSWAEVVAY